MKTKKWFWGLFFILGGSLFLMNGLGLFATSINVVSLLLTIGLVAVIVGSIIHFNFGGILVPLALIGVIHAEILGITSITPWPIIITAVLVSIGLDIIFHNNKHHVMFASSGKYARHFDENFEEIVDEEDNDEVSYNVQFVGGVKYVNTNNLKKAHLSCRFGALKAYFDNAKVDKGGAEIILDVSLSGVELYIPKEWNLIIEASAALGAVEEKNRRVKTDGPKVILKGHVSLAGVEIIYI